MWYLPYQLVSRTFSIYSIKGLCQKPHSQHRELTKLAFSGSKEFPKLMDEFWGFQAVFFSCDMTVISTGYVEELKSR